MHSAESRCAPAAKRSAAPSGCPAAPAALLEFAAPAARGESAAAPGRRFAAAPAAALSVGASPRLASDGR